MTPNDGAAVTMAAEEERQRFIAHHLFTCPECLTLGRCDWYRAALAEQLGADLAAYVLGEEGSSESPRD